MQSLWKRIGIVASAIVLVVGVAVVANAAGSNSSSNNVRYSACLQSKTKTLLDVVINRRASCSAGEREITWNASGPTGKAGAAGAAGTTWTTGSQAPTSIAGQRDGDLYFDNVSGEVFEVVSGAWVAEGNLRGPAGANGANGTSGANGGNGASVVTSSSTPTGSCTSGDTDIELDSGVVWKCELSSWISTGSSIKGPQGAPGLTSLSALQGSACTYLGDPSTLNVTQDPITGVVSIVCTPLPIFELSISVTNGPISSLEITVTPPSGPGGAIGNANSSFLSEVAPAGSSGTLTAISGSEVTGGGTGFTYTCDGSSTQSAVKTNGTSGIYYIGACNYITLASTFPMSVLLS